MSKIVNINDQSTTTNYEINQLSNPKAIFVKCLVKYTICHDEKEINEINILNKDELQYFKESFDKIIKMIYDTLKDQSGKNNSEIVPLPILPLHLDSKVTTSQQIQPPIHIDGKTHFNTKICEESNETFKESESLKKIWECDHCGLKLNNEENYTTHIK